MSASQPHLNGHKTKTSLEQGQSPPPNVSPDPPVDPCSCCPYGYHIDRGFVKYVEDVYSGSYAKHLRNLRRSRRKMRKSMELFLGDKVGGSSCTPAGPPHPPVQSPPPSAPPMLMTAAQNGCREDYGLGREDLVSPVETQSLFSDSLENVMSDFEETWSGSQRRQRGPMSHRGDRGYTSDMEASRRGDRSFESAPLSPGLPGPPPIPAEKLYRQDGYASDYGYAVPSVYHRASAASNTGHERPTQLWLSAVAGRGQLRAPPGRRPDLNSSSEHYAPPSSLSETQRADSVSSLSSLSSAQSPQAGSRSYYESDSGLASSTPANGAYRGLAGQLASNLHNIARSINYGPGPRGPTPPSPPEAPAVLHAMRDQMAISIKHMQDLESQVKHIPMLNSRISILKDEKERLESELATLRSVGEPPAKPPPALLKYRSQSYGAIERQPAIPTTGAMVSLGRLLREDKHQPPSPPVPPRSTSVDKVQGMRSSMSPPPPPKPSMVPGRVRCHSAMSQPLTEGVFVPGTNGARAINLDGFHSMRRTGFVGKPDDPCLSDSELVSNGGRGGALERFQALKRSRALLKAQQDGTAWNSALERRDSDAEVKEFLHREGGAYATSYEQQFSQWRQSEQGKRSLGPTCSSSSSDTVKNGDGSSGRRPTHSVLTRDIGTSYDLVVPPPLTKKPSVCSVGTVTAYEPPEPCTECSLRHRTLRTTSSAQTDAQQKLSTAVLQMAAPPVPAACAVCAQRRDPLMADAGSNTAKEPTKACGDCAALRSELLLRSTPKPQLSVSQMTDPLPPCAQCTVRSKRVLATTGSCTDAPSLMCHASCSAQLPVPCPTCIAQSQRVFYSIGFGTDAELRPQQMDQSASTEPTTLANRATSTDTPTTQDVTVGTSAEVFTHIGAQRSTGVNSEPVRTQDGQSNTETEIPTPAPVTIEMGVATDTWSHVIDKIVLQHTPEKRPTFDRGCVTYHPTLTHSGQSPEKPQLNSVACGGSLDETTAPPQRTVYTATENICLKSVYVSTENAVMVARHTDATVRMRDAEITARVLGSSISINTSRESLVSRGISEDRVDRVQCDVCTSERQHSETQSDVVEETAKIQLSVACGRDLEEIAEEIVCEKCHNAPSLLDQGAQTAQHQEAQIERAHSEPVVVLVCPSCKIPVSSSDFGNRQRSESEPIPQLREEVEVAVEANSSAAAQKSGQFVKPRGTRATALSHAAATKKLLTSDAQASSPSAAAAGEKSNAASFRRGTYMFRSMRVDSRKGDSLAYIADRRKTGENSATSAEAKINPIAPKRTSAGLKGKVAIKRASPAREQPTSVDTGVDVKVNIDTSVDTAPTTEENDEAQDTLAPLPSELSRCHVSYDGGYDNPAAFMEDDDVSTSGDGRLVSDVVESFPKPVGGIGHSSSSSSAVSSPSSSEAEESPDEGSYDTRGAISDTCDLTPADPSQSPSSPPQPTKATFQLTEPLKEAMVMFSAALNKTEAAKEYSQEQVTSAKAYLKTEWLKTAARKNAIPLVVEAFLDALETYGKSLLTKIANSPDQNENTALHYAVSHGNFDVVSVLLDSKVCNINKPNKAGYTPVMLAALCPMSTETDQVVIQRLFHMGDVNIKASQHGQTALMLAVSHGRVETTGMLLAAGAGVNIQDQEGSTALMCAAEHGHKDLVRTLLQHQDIDASLADYDGSTALSIAVDNGHRDIGVLIYAHLNYARGSSPSVTRRHFSASSSIHNL